SSASLRASKWAVTWKYAPRSVSTCGWPCCWLASGTVMHNASRTVGVMADKITRMRSSDKPMEPANPRAPPSAERFELVCPFEPTGDQPAAIEKLSAGLKAGQKHQTLLGITGSGKTFTMAAVIEKVNRPTLVLSPNKTLAAQLFAEFKE